MTTPSPDPDPLDPATEAPPSPPRVRVRPLRFQAPESPSSSPHGSSPETASAGSAGPDSGDTPPSSDGPLEPPSTPSGSSRESSPGRPASKADRGVIEETAANVVQGAGLTAHQLLCKDQADRAVGLYLTDEQDQQGIAKPVGGLLSRRGVGDGLGGNTDLADLIGLGIALAVYVVKQVQRIAAARALRAGGQPAPGFEAAAGSDDPGPQQ